ncbi:MAG: hypothetical protein KAW17_11800 [Candidatus Eisenbacteria sp.]|nr:hypothetical protein [Candidatus Eisenbacteria bacterium]
MKHLLLIAVLALCIAPHTSASASSAGIAIFEFDEDGGDWFVLEDCCRSVASVSWDSLDWAGPHTQGSLLLEADLIDGSDLTDCGIAIQSAAFNDSLPPGTGLLGDFSSGFGAFTCWLFVPDTTAIGPEGLKARLFARTGDAENHPAWGDFLGWDRYDGSWVSLIHGWNRVWVPMDSACHHESGEPHWGSIEYLDILQALGVEVASTVDQAVRVHVDHCIATGACGAVIESVTWCGVPAHDCYGVDEPFGVRLEFGPTLPDTLYLKGASISIRWFPHQLEMLTILEGDVWDAAFRTIDNAQGMAQIDLVSYEPQGVRASPEDLVARFFFMAERSGRAPYWITSIELRDAENFDVLPDTSYGDLAGDFWYYLGDFTEDVYGGYLWSECPDRDIDVFDINAFSIHYGLVEEDSLFDCRVDIGPTSTGWIHGIPTPDGVIDYDDLAIFAAAYAYQEGELNLPLPPPAESWDELRSLVVEAMASRRRPGPGQRQTVDYHFSPSDTSILLDDSVWVDVRVGGDVADFKTYRVLMEYDPEIVELLTLRQGPLLFESPHQTFFRNRSEGDSLNVLDSILGAGLTVSGPGSIIRMLFRAVGHGTSPLHFNDVRPADVWGLGMAATATDGSIQVIDPTGVTLDEGTEAPAAPGPITVSPNPSDGICRLRFSRPDDGLSRRLEIEIFDVRGRRIRSLRPGPSPSGQLSVEWDGRDTMGRRVPAGVYFAVLRAGSEKLHAKIILAN